MLPELSEDFELLLTLYSHKDNRIKALAKETNLANIYICNLFNITQSKLFVLLTVPSKNRPFIGSYKDRENKRRSSINNRQSITQNLVRLR